MATSARRIMTVHAHQCQVDREHAESLLREGRG
jgi:hypothetical protein